MWIVNLIANGRGDEPVEVVGPFPSRAKATAWANRKDVKRWAEACEIYPEVSSLSGPESYLSAIQLDIKEWDADADRA